MFAGVAVCSAVIAGSPPSPPPASPAPQPASAPGAPDDDFIEFLGADDVGDAAWWEFLKRAPPPRRVNPPAAPPQDVKQ